MIDENGQEINKSILPLIGKTLDLNGKLRTENGWKVLYVNSDNFRKYL
ncbi:MAG: hypothetical protein ACJAUH_002765 [Saprospiraceae bacterium]